MLQYLKPFAAVLTFILGIFAVSVLMPLRETRPGHDCRVDKAGQPLDPRAVCDVYRPVGEPVDFPATHTVCELMRRPERYTNEVVQVRATMKTAAGQWGFLDKSCGGEQWIRVSCENGYAACTDLFRTLSSGTQDRAEIVAVGIFNPTYRMSTSPTLFQITRINSLKITSETGVFDGDRTAAVGEVSGSGIGDGDGSGR